MLKYLFVGCRMTLVWWCSLIAAAGAAAGGGPRSAAPHFPSAFSADVRIVSHVLEESMRTPETGYPPRERVLKLAYDRGAQAARIEEGDIAHVRRFDLKKEIRVDGGPYPSCKRSYLSEPLPKQQFPRGGRWAVGGDGDDGAVPCPKPHTGRSCLVWRQEEGAGQVALVYVERNSYMPLQAVVADVVASHKMQDTKSFDADLEPLMTFSWENIVLGPPDMKLFADVTEEREDCERQAGGFPWVHVFHSYFKI